MSRRRDLQSGRWPLVAILCLALAVSCSRSKQGAEPAAAVAEVRPREVPAAVEQYNDGRAEHDNHPDGDELASHQAGPSFIAVDGRFVYWTNYGDDRIMKVSKRGGAAPLEIHRNDPGQNKHIAVNERYLYWGGSSLYRQSKADGAIRKIANSTSLAYNIVPLPDGVIWNDNSGQVQLTTVGNDGRNLSRIGPPTERSFIFASDGRWLFAARFSSDAEDSGVIEVSQVNGGPPVLFAHTRWVWRVAIDETYVYWLEGKTAGAIKRKQRRGDGPIQTLTSGFDIRAPQSMALDRDAIYWTELGIRAGAGRVGRVSKMGGDARILTQNQIVPLSVAVDDHYVYWANFGPTNGGSIRRLEKPTRPD